MSKLDIKGTVDSTLHSTTHTAATQKAGDTLAHGPPLEIYVPSWGPTLTTQQLQTSSCSSQRHSLLLPAPKHIAHTPTKKGAPTPWEQLALGDTLEGVTGGGDCQPSSLHTPSQWDTHTQPAGTSPAQHPLQSQGAPTLLTKTPRD